MSRILIVEDGLTMEGYAVHGVGLAMVKHIVAAHRGEIHVHSTPGEGSTFTVLLPALEAS
jgi:signal transduction histidine kinase